MTQSTWIGEPCWFCILTRIWHILKTFLTFLDTTAAELAKMNRKKNGRPFAYSETLIISIATIRAICGISYRMCEGLAQETLGRENAPDFATL